MRSSSSVAYALMLIAAVAIAFVRPRLADDFHRLQATSDVYALPSPEQTVAVSLGYRSALADLLFSHVLVSYGLHFQEKRRFEFVGNYLDTINALDPTFRDPYRFADTLLTLAPVPPLEQDYDKAREILERGMKNRPNDQLLHSTAGQFMAYLAPGRFEDEKKKEEWRIAGARALARACELIGDNENIPYHCVTAASLFSKAGMREATRRFVERVLTISDNEEIQELALGYLGHELGEIEKERVERRFKAFHERWGEDLRFVSRDELLVLGPRFDAARCAGEPDPEEARCATSWRAWGKTLEDSP